MPIDEITSGGHMNEASEYGQAIQDQWSMPWDFDKNMSRRA